MFTTGGMRLFFGFFNHKRFAVGIDNVGPIVYCPFDAFSTEWNNRKFSIFAELPQVKIVESNLLTTLARLAGFSMGGGLGTPS